MREPLIDYDTWNFDGKGSNLKNLFNKEEEKIWEEALPFLDKRNDLGHSETTTYLAYKLLNFFPDARRKIVIPAAILHDSGWSRMTPTELELFYITDDDGRGVEIWRRYEPVLRARHQELGAPLTEEILNRNNLSKKSVSYICEIISGHDTRNEFFSLEDGITRSSDRLYRFTYPHLVQALKNRKAWTLEKINGLMEKWIEEDGFFWNNSIKEIARIEKRNTLDYNEKYPANKELENGFS